MRQPTLKGHRFHAGIYERTLYLALISADLGEIEKAIEQLKNGIEIAISPIRARKFREGINYQ
ncbi:MAG: hypothetical protein HY742_08425 [Deltaproteobacteria bacterium]|nr:hypothetical protein [Deltaproteobacteria bacterium]